MPRGEESLLRYKHRLVPHEKRNAEKNCHVTGGHDADDVVAVCSGREA